MAATEKPVERLLAEVRRLRPQACAERLTVTQPADDDHLYFVNDGIREVQLDCQPDGSGPFLIEGDDERVEAANVEAALATLHRMMRW